MRTLTRAVVLTAVCAAAILGLTTTSTASSGHPESSGPAAGTGYWHTSGNQILDSTDNPVRIAGINWYGFETADKVAHGLWGADYETIIDDIRDQGYNTIRLPFSNDVVEHPVIPSGISYQGQNGPINTELQGLDSLGVMDHIVDYAGQDGLKVILDDHRSESGNSAEQNGLWYTADYPQTAWVDDWVTLAKRYAGNPTVIGADLRNEPHTPAGAAYSAGATWGTGDPATDFRLASETAGNAILAVEPDWLIMVEGIGEYQNADGSVDSTWWGGDLQGAATAPVRLSVPGRLVYSAHDYGPDEFPQTWFNSTTTAASLDAVWAKYWGYLDEQDIAPVWVGEFGVPNTDVTDTAAGHEGQWFDALVGYLGRHPEDGWTYWALNGEDRYGLLDSQYDVTSASAAKQQLLAGIQSPLGQ